MTGKQLNAVKEAAEELDGLAVKYTDENKTAVDLGSATLTTTGAVTGGSFAVGDKTYISDAGLNANSQKITNVADGTIAENSTDAVNGGQLNAVDEKIDALDDLAVKYTDEKKTAVDLGSATLTTTRAVTGGSFAVNDKTYISDAGLNANSQKITNVADGTIGTDSKDAVNGSQLQKVYDAMKEIDGTTYADGDGISISGEDNKISVAYGDGLTTDRQGNLLVNAGDGLGFNEDDNSLEVVTGDGLTISRNGEVTAAVGNGLDFDSDGKIVVEAASGGNLTVDSNGISLNKELTGLTGISTETLTASSGITVGGTQYISTSGLNAGNHVITNVADGQNTNDAVNYGQLSALQKDFKELTDLAVTYTSAAKDRVELGKMEITLP